MKFPSFGRRPKANKLSEADKAVASVWEMTGGMANTACQMLEALYRESDLAAKRGEQVIVNEAFLGELVLIASFTAHEPHHEAVKKQIEQFPWQIGIRKMVAGMNGDPSHFDRKTVVEIDYELSRGFGYPSAWQDGFPVVAIPYLPINVRQRFFSEQ